MAHDNDAAAVAATVARAFWDPRDAPQDGRPFTRLPALSCPSVLVPANDSSGVTLPANGASDGAARRHEPRHRSHNHSHHGEHGHRMHWRGRSKWPTHLKRSVAAATVFTALLAWFWLLIGSCDPAFVAP